MMIRNSERGLLALRPGGREVMEAGGSCRFAVKTRWRQAMRRVRGERVSPDIVRSLQLPQHVQL